MDNLNITLPVNTDFLLLQQKVNLLETHMNWIIGGVTITIAVLLAIFAVIQFVYQRKIEKEEIKKIEEVLTQKIEEKLLEKEFNLQTMIERVTSKTEKDLKYKIGLMNADIARRFALDCAEDHLPATAFDWWLTAAAEYSENGLDEMRVVSVRASKEELEKIKTKFHIDSLLESIDQTTENLKKLRKNHSVEADLLEGLFKKKIESTPSN